MQASPVPLLLAVDGNSLLYRAYHAAATGRLVSPDGQPVWGVKGLIGYIARAAALLRPDAVLVGFDHPDDSARRDDYPDYKAHRPEKPSELLGQLAIAPELLRRGGLCTIVPDAYEADDVLASSAAQARRHGWRSVLVTSDRDAFALIDASTSVLRVRNGGLEEAVLVTAATLPDVCGVRPEQYRDFAALRGDPSDNLPGVRGLGSARAARLLAEFGSLETVWAALDGGDGAAVRALVGAELSATLGAAETRAAVERNRRLMLMRHDLPLPALDSARLPLNLLTIRRALSPYGIHLGPSLWALTGAVPPPEEGGPVIPQPQMWNRRTRANRTPTPGQLALF